MREATGAIFVKFVAILNVVAVEKNVDAAELMRGVSDEKYLFSIFSVPDIENEKIITGNSGHEFHVVLGADCYYQRVHK